MMYYVYIIKSSKTGDIYIGSTDNLKRRITEHNEGKSYSTKLNIPWYIVYYEAYKSEEDARTREHNLKYYGKALGQLKRRIQKCLS